MSSYSLSIRTQAEMRAPVAWDSSGNTPWIDLCRLFHFGNAYGERDMRNLENLAVLLCSGDVKVTRIRLPAAGGAWVRQFSGRTQEHQILCGRLANWITKLGMEWSGESEYAGGVCDVCAPSARLYCEAGYTNALKVIRGMQHDEIVVVAPYNNAGMAFFFRAHRPQHIARNHAKATKKAAQQMEKALAGVYGADE